jgi:hypothetical protein
MVCGGFGFSSGGVALAASAGVRSKHQISGGAAAQAK